jgi:hypothetical protein
MEPGISIVFHLRQPQGERRIGEGGPIRVDDTLSNGAGGRTRDDRRGMMDDGKQTTEGKWGRGISVYNSRFSIYYLRFCGSRVIDPHRKGW